MRRIQISTDNYYHVYNRGVEKRILFADTADYEHFLVLMHRSKVNVDGRKLVDLHAYACMPNHFHFLLEQAQENGIAIFMQRLGTRYARFFNWKY